jgi:hypothetical protein
MKRLTFIRVALLFNLILIPNAFAKMDFELFRKGVFITVAKPFPGIAGVGYNMTFADFIRVHAEVEAVMAFFSWGAQQYTYGGGVMLRVPTFRFTPVLALDYNVQKIGRVTRTWGKIRTDKYLIPGAGFEIGGKRFFAGLLLQLIYQKYNGKWTSLHQVNDNGGPSRTYWSSIYLGFNFF